MRVHTPIARDPGQRRKFIWPNKAGELVRANVNARGHARYKLITSLARMTGHPRDACLRFASRLGVSAKRPYQNWSPRETGILLRLSKSHPLPAVARKLQRSRNAVWGMLQRLGISAKTGKDGWTKYVLASFLHVRPHTVQKWVDKGWLKGHKEGTTRLPRLVIGSDDFLRFLKRHPDAVFQGHLREDRLNFIFKHVVPRSYVDRVPVKPARKKRAARRPGPQGGNRSQELQRGRTRRRACRAEEL
jgi:hypothetical protein